MPSHSLLLHRVQAFIILRICPASNDSVSILRWWRRVHRHRSHAFFVSKKKNTHTHLLLLDQSVFGFAVLRNRGACLIAHYGKPGAVQYVSMSIGTHLFIIEACPKTLNSSVQRTIPSCVTCPAQPRVTHTAQKKKKKMQRKSTNAH